MEGSEGLEGLEERWRDEFVGTDGSIRIAPFEARHLDRIVEITLEGFHGVSIDYLIEERFGFVAPGWKERKASDVRKSAEREPDGIFVALDGDEVIGYVTVETVPQKSIGRIADLAVDARYRRRGLGTLLIERALTYIKEKGMRLAKIETLANNEAGQAAYPKMGFVEVARQVHYVMPLDDERPTRQ